MKTWQKQHCHKFLVLCSIYLPLSYVGMGEGGNKYTMIGKIVYLGEK